MYIFWISVPKISYFPQSKLGRVGWMTKFNSSKHCRKIININTWVPLVNITRLLGNSCNVMILMMSGFVMLDIIFIWTGVLLLSHQHDNGSFIDFLEKHLLSCIIKNVDPFFKLSTTPSYGFDHLRTVLEKRLDSSSSSTASCSTGKTNCYCM